MLTRRALRVARLRGWLPSTFKGWALVIVALAYIASIIGNSIINGAGDGVVLGVNVALIVLDARAWASLGGLVTWSRLGTWARIGLVLLLCTGWIVPGIVLWRLAVRAHRAQVAAWQAEQAARPARIAALERDLGMTSLDRPQPPQPQEGK